MNEELCYVQKLIDAIKQVLIEYPDTHLETITRLYEGLVNHHYYYMYYELLLAAKDHIDESFNKTIMASRIKRHFKKAMSDPSYKMCRDRLTKEFNEQLLEQLCITQN
jgi:hypothetical protein